MAAAEGRLHEVQSLLDGGRCRVNDEDEVCMYVPVGWNTSISECEGCCVFAVKVCLSRKSRSGLDGMIVISPTYVCMYVCTYVHIYIHIYLLFGTV